MSYKIKAFKFLPNECWGCRIEKNLEVHHKDGNKNNNKLSNLRILCADCHRRLEKRGKPKIRTNLKYARGTKKNHKNGNKK